MAQHAANDDAPAEQAPLRAPLVRIRAAQPADLAALSEMIGELAAHHGDAASLSPEVLERDLFGPVPWIAAVVAQAEGRLIGYALLVPLYRAQEGRRGMDLHHLYVRSAHRGSGIGRHLVEAAREQARRQGCSFLQVSAATGNVQAHRFYESEHFTPRPVTGMRYIQPLA
ncbi:GNAT family N-acetyltransferase [Xaviernesmea oryzae]|uniref:GNAT family N-acetyltransferase n=1 Tax=Xaviernesmea oryzae TaxID=464029 RepID=A0A1Q9B3G2_9HYPH|nr:GNAT family N-acetyltransferase [Xaviernesmea oryzae]OLP62588.1 GNAT family N-acetyltransferase [Xaviernesmea oryzae]